MNISFEQTSNTLPTGLASLPISEGSKRRSDNGVRRNRRNKRVRRGDQHSGMNMSMQDNSIRLSEFSDSPRHHVGSPMRDESLDDFAESLREATMASYSMLDFSNVSISGGGGPSLGRATGGPNQQRLSQMIDLSARDTTMNTSIQGVATPSVNFYNTSFGGNNSSVNSWGSFAAGVNRANSGSGNSLFPRIPRDGPDRL